MIPAYITTRETEGTGATNKGSPLTNSELDTNFISLNDSLVDLQGQISLISGGSGLQTTPAKYTDQSFNSNIELAMDLPYDNKKIILLKTQQSNLTLRLDSPSWQSPNIYNTMYAALNESSYNESAITVLLYIINQSASPMTLTWDTSNTNWTKVFPGGTAPAGPAANQVNAYLLNYVATSYISSIPASLNPSYNVFVYPVATNLVGVS